MKNWIIAILFSVAMGCAHPHPVYFKTPAKPPTVPAPQVVPLDPQLRESAKALLLKSAASSDPVIRATAIEAIQDSLGNEGGETVLHGLDDSDPLVRFAAAMAAGKLQLVDGHATFLKLLDDPDPNVKVGALFALHRIGNTSHSHELEGMATSPLVNVRCNVALALGMLGDPSALRLLKGMTKDKEVVVRLRVADAMWRLGSEQGLQTLLAGTFGQYADDQLYCVLALGQRHDKQVRATLYGELTSDFPEVSLTAARAMGMIGSDEGYGVALNGAKSGEWPRRSLAALAFGEIGRSDAQNTLRELLKDPEPPVQVAAATAILQLKVNR